MALLGEAAMLLSFDVAPEAIPEHDEWHTHEHLPERLTIPGSVRGGRWIALRREPRYFVMYEVERLAALTSKAYLERLNHPSPWTSRMMVHYRNMRRGFCSVSGSFGCGIGHVGLLKRFNPAPGADAALRKWLLHEALPPLPSRPGIGSVHLFEGTFTPEMTTEQRIRGADANVDWALFATGYELDPWPVSTRPTLAARNWKDKERKAYSMRRTAWITCSPNARSGLSPAERAALEFGARSV